MKEYWGEDRTLSTASRLIEVHRPTAYSAVRTGIFCTIYAAGLYGIILTFNLPYIWELLACLGTAILYAWAVNAKLKPLLNSEQV